MHRFHAPIRALGAALFVTLAPLAEATPYDEGMKALDRWDTPRATAQFEEAAKQGDGRGLYELAKVYFRSDRQRQMDYLERAVALGEPRANLLLAGILADAPAGTRKPDVSVGEGPTRIPKLLASACEKQVIAACGDLAALHAGDIMERTRQAGLPGADPAQAKRWGDLWRAARIREAEGGNIGAIQELVMHGGKAWTGMDAATLAFYRLVFDDVDGDGAPPRPDRKAAPVDPGLRKRADAWEIAHGLRPAQLPSAEKLATGIAAFEAADARIDQELIAATGRSLAASTLGAYNYREDWDRPSASALGRATAAATREAATYFRQMAAAEKKLGLDTETWLARRLATTFTPLQLHALARLQASAGAKKRAPIARAARTAFIDGEAIRARLSGDPGMAYPGVNIQERMNRYAKDRGIDLFGTAADPLVDEREGLLSAVVVRVLGQTSAHQNVGATARLGHAAWTRAAMLPSRTDADQIRATLFCGPCRGTERLLQQLMEERLRAEPIRAVVQELQQRVVTGIENAGVVLQQQ